MYQHTERSTEHFYGWTIPGNDHKRNIVGFTPLIEFPEAIVESNICKQRLVSLSIPQTCFNQPTLLHGLSTLFERVPIRVNAGQHLPETIST